MSRPVPWNAALLCAGLVLAACAQREAAPAAAPAAYVELRLIALNDFHGYIDPPGELLKLPAPGGGTEPVPAGGAAYLAGAIQALRAGHPHSIVIGAGDLVGASPLDSNLFHDEPAVAALDRMGLELSAVGNHEFDQGRTELLRKQNGGCYPGGTRGKDTCVDGDFAGAHFHYLAANVVDAASGETILPPYEIKPVDDGRGGKLPVAFVGVVEKNTPADTMAGATAGLSFTDEADAANALLPKLHAQGVKAVVLLIHQGGDTDGSYNDKTCPGLRGDILPIVDRLDPAYGVIVSAHTHKVYNCRYHDRLLTSAGAYGQYLTAIDLRLDPRDGAIVSAEADNVPVVNDRQPGDAAHYPAYAPDAALAQLAARYDALSAPVTGRVVGRVSDDIVREVVPAGESPLGELIADSELAATRRHGAVAAMINQYGVRADLLPAQISGGEQPGEVTYGEAYQVLPFGNRLVTLTLSGEQLYALLDQQWSGRTRRSMLQVSRGLSYTWDDSRPVDAKVVPGSLRINGRAVRAHGRYRITVVDFLASGGDHFAVFKEGARPVQSGLALDAFIDYLGRHSPMAAPATDRVSQASH